MDSQFNNLMGGFKGTSDPNGQKKNRSLMGEAMSQFIFRGFLIIIALAALVFVAFIAFVVIDAVGNQMEFGFRYVQNLFREAKYMSHSARGFGAFIKLMLIAGFLGWAIKRFRRK